MSSSLLQAARSFLQRHFVVSILIVLCAAFLLGWLSYRGYYTYAFGGLGALALAGAILYSPWNGLYLLTFFLPFERLGSVDAGGMTIRPSQVTALLMIISIALHYLHKRRFPVPRNPIALPFGIFTIVSIWGLISATNLERSITVLLFIIFTFAIACAVPFVLQSKEHVRKLVRYLLASFVVVTVFGLFQFVGDWIGLPTSITGLRELYTKDILGFPRIQSTALEPLYFANYLLIPLSILLAFFFARERFIKSYIVAGLLALGLVNLVLTVARGGYLAFALSALCIAVYYFFKLELLNARTIGYGILGAVIGIIIVSKLVGVGVVYEKFATHVGNPLQGASYNERVEMFHIATNAWKEHPWVGIGAGGIGPYSSAHPYVVPEHGWRIVNNEYLELLAEHGVLGLGAMIVLFLIVIIRSVKAIVRTKDPYIQPVLVGFLCAFLGILAQYNTFSILYIVHIWFTIGVLIALQNMVLSPAHVHSASRSSHSK